MMTATLIPPIVLAYYADVGGKLYEELGRQDGRPLMAAAAAHYKTKGTFFWNGHQGASMEARNSVN
jgi:hypothetical protein